MAMDEGVDKSRRQRSADISLQADPELIVNDRSNGGGDYGTPEQTILRTA